MRLREFIKNWLECVRAYSIPITVMSWAVIFAYGVKMGGNVWLGLLAGVGIELAHLATNLVDDYLDYKIICRDQNFHNTVQKGKCRLICEGIISHKQIGIAIIILCSIAALIGIILFFLSGPHVWWLMAIGAAAVLFYQKCSLIGCSELAVGIVYGPLLFEGTYYVMTGTFSLEVLILSLVSVMFSEQFLYTHTLLDYDGDMISHKKTLCCRIGDKNKALWLLGFFFLVGFGALLALTFMSKNYLYLIGFLTLPYILWLFKELFQFNTDKTVLPHINKLNFPLDNWEQVVKDGAQSFYFRLLLSRNIMMYMSFILIATIAFG